MSAKSFVNRTTVPTIRANTGAPKDSSLIVNNRNLGARGDLSQGFGSQSATSREKMQLRHLMAKTNSELYENNPIAKRRMEQKIAVKASEMYGMDPRQLLSGASQPVSGGASAAGSSGSSYASRFSNANLSDNYGLRDKMKAGS